MYKTLLGMVNGGFVPTESSSTKVHSNIDNLILQSELDKFAQTGWMSEDRTPEYIGGTDDVVANVAMSPLLAAKKIPSLLKAIKDMGLKNPLYHFTSAPKASGIIKSGTITGSEGAFPGRAFKGETNILKEPWAMDEPHLSMWNPKNFGAKSPAVSVTRDPKFTSRPHKHVGTDVRFIMDRDEMIKKGLKIEPFVEEGFEKWRQLYGGKSLGDIASGKLYKTGVKPNPMFEFEERVRGNIPTENIKLIDLLKFPKWAMEDEVPGMVLRQADFLRDISRKKIPIMMSEEARSGMKQLGDVLERTLFRSGIKELRGKELLTSKEFEKLMKAPTYKFDPFKVNKPSKIKVWDENLQKAVIIDKP